MTKSNQTKQVKQILAALLVSVKTNRAGTMVSGHSDEVMRARAKLAAAGFEIFCSNDDSFVACADCALVA